MIVRVLGSAAGGGLPQWNCACPHCDAARAGRIPRRLQSSFAVSGDGRAWWLVNVSPDVAAQIEAAPALQPQAGRETPIAGMLLTDANVDHLGGLAVLRQAGAHAFRLFSSETVRTLALGDRAFAPFAAAPHAWRAVEAEEAFDLDERLSVRVVPVAGLTPGYAGRLALADAVVAYRIEDRTAKASAVFAPVFAALSDRLFAAVGAADVAFLDGSFWSERELESVGVQRTASALGHCAVGGPDGSLEALKELTERTRVYFAHLNNTNPLVDSASLAYADARKRGVDIVHDGLEITL